MTVSPGSSASSAEPGPDPHEVFARALIGTRIGGRYVVEKVLGRGGMGVVVAARYPELEQNVAIKLMFPEHASNTTLAKRFMREAKVAAKVRSPNLVRVSDIGHLESGVPYLVMELLAGHDLDKELAMRGPLPVEEAVDYALQTASGLAELHALGIVHRDLKPGNLFLAESASGVDVKILDYGISKESLDSSRSLTVTDALIGTPSHMSPEQIKTPKEVDARSDIWSLGIILYELLTNKLPYELEGSTMGELFGLIIFSDPIPLRQRRPEIPEALAAVVMKCLRRERSERWTSVAELAEGLGPFARAESRHRVAAIAKALGQPPSSPALPARKPAAEEKATVVAGTQRALRAGAVIAPSDPSLRSSPDAHTAVAGASEDRVAISKSLATSERAVSPVEPASRKGIVAALAGGAMIVGAAAVVLLLRGAPSSKPSGITQITQSVRPAESGGGVPAAEPSPPPPELVSTAVVVPSASSAATATTKPPAGAVALGAPPKPLVARTFPSATASAPPRAAASAAKAADDLILDRK